MSDKMTCGECKCGYMATPECERWNEEPPYNAGTYLACEQVKALAAARAEVDRLTGAVQTLTRDGLRLQDESDRLRADLHVCQLTIDAVHKALGTETATEIESRARWYVEECDRLRRERDEWMTSSNAARSEMYKALSRAEARVKKLEERLEALLDAPPYTEEARIERDMARAELDRTCNRHIAGIGELQAAEARVKELTEDVILLKTQREQHEQQIAEWQQKAWGAEDRVKELEGVIEFLLDEPPYTVRAQQAREEARELLERKR